MTAPKKTPVSGPAAEFGARLRGIREHRGWSLETAAEKCGVHFTYLGRAERGVQGVRLETIVKIAYGFQIDPAVLITGIQPDPM
ncbi:helix-turn-helix domain-containing protein [Tomitella biformata]|uniref:helix-turn-helix domain-containing protein n=1 Tax=Tomitella biformata TaxID=630403 RepID=UPI0004661F6C|nr:helix-turn-helix transcriptional regulator [Tomitella biformata]